MKLYYFNPNNYGEQFFVMAKSEDNAIKSLNEYLMKYYEKIKATLPMDAHLIKEVPPKWGDESFKNYTIITYGENEVIDELLN